MPVYFEKSAALQQPTSVKPRRRATKSLERWKAITDGASASAAKPVSGVRRS